jgi:hypothetical protein
MLVTYEIRSFHHKTVEVEKGICPLCQQKSEQKLHLMQKYIWCFILLGSTLPSKKYGVLECTACNKAIPTKNWSTEVKAIYNAEKALLKTPIRFWKGSIFLMCLMVATYIWFEIGHTKSKKITSVSAELQSIKEGDLLAVCEYLITKESAGGYSTDNSILKVQKIEGNKVHLITYPNHFSWHEALEMNKDDFDAEKFGTETITISLKRIKEGKLVKLNAKGIEMNENYQGVSFIMK